MRARLFCAFAVIASLFRPSRASAVADPRLIWRTITTNRFQITYPSQVEDVAQRVAVIAENAHKILSPVLGWEPKERTQILLTDDSDSANGSATSLPYDAIRLYVTAPDDIDALSDYDDWYTELVTHEYTHILHTDHITGLPAIYDAIFGKVLSPNQMQPRWILEGLAVLEESRFTSGGRERSATFDMYLRADVLEDNIAPIDQISHTPRRWPQGNLWYLYGSHFLDWIHDKYGDKALAQVAADYGAQIIPYGINRAIYRATGETYIELYAQWIAWMKDRYAAQQAAVLARGRREGTRITFHGESTAHPRYAPLTSGSGAKPGVDRRIVYHRDDAHSTAGLYSIDVGQVGTATHFGPQSLLTRDSGTSRPTFLPNGDLVYDSVEVSRQVYFFYDLFFRKAGDVGDTVTLGKRLTVGLRASEPDVSPNGHRVAFVINGEGTKSLAVAEVNDEDGTLGPARWLVQSQRYDEIYTPRWSPDGTKVAYSVWHKGGYRDIELVDVASGAVTSFGHDRALDTGPVFSRDGTTLFFSSDRTGIANIFAVDIATKELRQVTNVINGAFQPDVSPDGKHLLYLGYTHLGYDLFEIDLDRTQWIDAPPYVEQRPPQRHVPAPEALPSTPYNPLPTLRPYTWSFSYQPDAFGHSLTFTTQGADIVGHHSFAASVGASLDKGEPLVDLQYTYGGLPVDMSIEAYRNISAQGGYRTFGQTPTWVQQTIGANVGLTYPLSTAFWAQTFNAAYSFSQFRALGGLPKAAPDPYAEPNVYPQAGVLGSVHLGYAWSNVQGYLWSVGAEKGYAFSTTLDVARKALGSDFDVLVAAYSAVGYFPMPWARHHVLALHAQGGALFGDYDGRGAFALGGFSQVPITSAVINVLTQSGVQLRGYKPGSIYGDSYQLFNAEYRFPIVNLDRGIETLPFFIERLYGDVFTDYGDATFDSLDLLKMHLGLGAELFVDFTIGYFEDLTMRFGLARGTSTGGVTQSYVVLSAPF